LIVESTEVCGDTKALKRLIQLARTGLQAEDLQRLIRNAPAVRFNLIPAETDELQKEGISQDTIKIMAARQNGKLPSAVSGTPSAPQDRAHLRVFVTDSPNAWSGSGSHPQTAEIIKTITQECKNATVTNDRLKANYVVLLERESQKVIRRDNKMVIFDKAGDVVYAASTRALGNAVRNGCDYLK
jgi:ribosomal protein L14